MDPDACSGYGIRRTAQICAAMSGGIALVICGGWVLGRWKFATFGANYIPMAPSTALLLLILSVAVFVRAGCHVRRANTGFAMVAASLTFVTGLLLLSQSCLGLHTDFERWLSRTSETVGGVPAGRMSPVTAIAFLFTSVALFLKLPPLVKLKPARHLSAALDSVVMTGSLIIVMAYSYGTPLFYSTNTIPMALLTAVAFALLSLAIELSWKSDLWFLSMFTGNTVYSQIAQLFIPVIFLLTILQNWLSVTTIPRLIGNQALYFGLFAMACALTSASLAWLLARRIGGRVGEADRMQHLSEAALREREKRYSDLYENAPDMFVSVDAATGCIIQCNATTAKVTGYAKEEIIGMPIFEMYEPDCQPRVRELFVKFKATGELVDEELRLRCKDGRTLDVCLSTSAVRDTTGSIVSSRSVWRDITARKQAEVALRESEARLRNIFEQASDGIFLISSENHYLEANVRGIEMLGYTLDELLQMNVADVLVPRERHRLNIESAEMMAGKPHFAEWEHLRKDGSTFLAEVSARRLSDKTYLAIVRDITARKQVEAALREKEHLLSESQRIANIGSWKVELNGIHFWTAETYRIFGVGPESIRVTTEAFLELIHPDDRNLMMDWIAKCVSGEKPRALEFRIVRPDGTVRFLHGEGELIRDIDGKPSHLIGTVQDITDRKQAEETLRAQHSELENLYATTPVGLALIDRNLRFLRINERLAAINGKPVGAHLGRTVAEALPELAGVLEPIYRRVLDKGESVLNVEIQGVTSAAPGILRDWLASYHPMRTADGSVIGVSIAVLDITERKRVEATLRETQRQLTSLIANLPGVVYRCRNDMNWTTEFVSEGVLHIFGYPAADFMEHRREIGQSIHPDDQCRVWEEIQAALRECRRYELTYRIITASGEEKCLWEQGGGVFDASGTLQVLEGFVVDITERKRMETVLQESEERLRLAVKASGVGIWEWQVATDQLTWDDQLKAIFGLPVETTGLTLDKFIAAIHPDDRIEVEWTFREALEHHTEFNSEYRIRWSDGAVRWIIAIGRGDYDAFGKPLRMRGSALDITKRKQVEMALRKSHERLKKVLEVETVGVMFWDLTSGCLMDANDTFLNVMGYSRREVAARELTWQKLTPPEYMDVSRAEIRKFQVSGRVGPYEKEYLRKDGTRQWFVFAGSSLGDNTCVEFCVDISERKEMEAALCLSESRYRNLAESLCQLVYEADPDTFVATYVNGFVQELYGYSPSEWLADPALWENTLYPDDKERVFDEFRASKKHSDSGVIQYRIFRREGTVRWVEDHVSWGKDEHGQIVCMRGVMYDITDRKQAEEIINNLNLKLEQRVKELVALNKLSNTINANLLLNQVIRAALFEIVSSVKPDIALIYLRQDDKLILRGAMPDNIAQSYREVRLTVGECLCGLAASQGIPVFSGNIHNDQRCTLDACKHAGLRSLAALPLISGGKILGVVGLAWFTERAFGEQARFWETLAGEIAIGIQNALLYEQLQGYATELEQRVAKRTAQLEAANKDLETFSYSVSHDLRAPLRAISGFADIIARRHSVNLNEEGRHYVDNIVHAGDRMWRLIDDLLTYSRLGRRGVQHEPVLLRDLFNQLAGDLSLRLKGIGGSLNIADDMPSIIGDKTLLIQIFTNLLENAITYRRTYVPVKVAVTWHTEGKDVIIHVADNGIGIPSEHYEKIFNIFQRLHTEEEYPGTGIGLATVKKSVELLGGSVWVESVVGEGSTFFVKLPKEDA